MADYLVAIAARRFAPPEGWLAFGLLLGSSLLFLLAVLEIAWVADDGILFSTGAVGFVVALLLVRKGRYPAWDAALTGGTVLAAAFLHLSRVSPWRLLTGSAAAWLDWRLALQLLLVRLESWASAVSRSQATRETIVFTLLLGLAAGLLVALLVWATIRKRRPLPVVALMMVALAANTHFGGGSPWLAVWFALAGFVLTAVTHAGVLESRWIAQAIDYSEEIRQDLIVAACIAGAVLAGLSLLVNDFNTRLTRLALAFQQSDVARALDDTLSRAFGGVQARPAPAPPVGPGSGEGGAAAPEPGIFPRDFLLGDPPELAETPVFEAVLSGADRPVTFHWRFTSYAIYTGRGWLTGPETSVDLKAGAPLGQEVIRPELQITQTVTWVAGDTLPGYFTLGPPLAIDQPVRAFERTPDDLIRIIPRLDPFLPAAAANRYTAVSLNRRIEAAVLRQAALAEVPREILDSYTRLPGEIPNRVRRLAAEVAGDRDNPYDRAVALESFLRQYPYTLEVEPVPAGVEVVDYFLFTLQRGYCDYYATAMVVMARSLGLPARLGVGYLSRPAEGAGRQRVLRADGHSWAEIYFAGFGWVEFEPTAPFPTLGGESETNLDSEPIENRLAPPALPPPRPAGPALWSWLVPLFFFTGLVAYGIHDQRRAARRLRVEVVWSYDRLRRRAARLGWGEDPSRTPREFGAVLTANLLREGRGVEGRRLHQAVDRLVGRLERQVYGPPPPLPVDERDRASTTGERRLIESLLRRLQIRRLLGRFRPF